MALTGQQKDEVTEIIKSCLRNKFQYYKPESSQMPFHFRFLGRDRMALFSFIQSLNTTFGTSIFEPVAVALAKLNHRRAEKQYIVGGQISASAQTEIQDILNNLTIGGAPNKAQEMARIRGVCQTGVSNRLKPVKADLFLETYQNEIYLFDLKTAKPNISNFKDFKRTMLEWAAIFLHDNPTAQVNTLIAIPITHMRLNHITVGLWRACWIYGWN